MASRLIINPYAGQKAGISTNAAGLPDVLAALERHGISPEVVRTERPGHAEILAREAVRRGDDLVIAAGGDGTVREIANALVGSSTDLALIPLGSVMNVSRMLGIGRDVDTAAELIRRRHVVSIDVGRVGGRIFLEGAGAGISAGVFHHANELDRGNWDSARALARFALSFRPRRIRVTCDGVGRAYRGYMVTVSNGPAVGLLNVAPDANVRDHHFDVTVFPDFGRGQLFLDCLRLMRGNRVCPTRSIHLRARVVTVSAAQPMPVHADDEVVGITPASFDVMPESLRVIVAPSAGNAPAVFGDRGSSSQRVLEPAISVRGAFDSLVERPLE